MPLLKSYIEFAGIHSFKAILKRGMLHTLRLIPDAGYTDPFHIQRTQKPGSKESGFIN